MKEIFVDNNNGKKGAASPVTPPPQINPEDIAAQMGVMRTKQGGTALMFPKNDDGTPNLPLTLELMATGLGILSQIVSQMVPQEAKRIVVVPGLPPGVSLRGRAGG